MASCYGGSEPGAADGTLRVAECCPYLPIRCAIERNGTSVTIQLACFKSGDEMQQGLTLMNDVIVEGKSWPFDTPFPSEEAYRNYFHSHASFAVTFCDSDEHGSDVIGCFYIKPNFPGRCSHVCNGGFITNPKYRGLGVGKFMGQQFKRLAKDLGYKSSLFNLVFANNTASVRLWRSLGFKQLATIPKAAALNGCDELVDAIQMYCDFYEVSEGDAAVESSC